MFEPLNHEKEPFFTLEKQTSYNNYKKYRKQIAEVFENGKRTEETREVMVTIEIPEGINAPLEKLLLHSFNEKVTDPTPIEFRSKNSSDPIFLTRSKIETRFVSAPKFLIFNFSRTIIDPQTGASKKLSNMVGLQKDFYLTGHLTIAGKGAKYHLQSFNIHIGSHS